MKQDKYGRPPNVNKNKSITAYKKAMILQVYMPNHQYKHQQETGRADIYPASKMMTFCLVTLSVLLF
jgi:hypothetical protein